MNKSTIYQFLFENGDYILASGYDEEEAREKAIEQWVEIRERRIKSAEAELSKLLGQCCKIKEVTIPQEGNMFRIQTTCTSCNQEIDVFSANQDVNVSSVVCDECEQEPSVALLDASKILQRYSAADEAYLDAWYNSMYPKGGK